MKSLAARFFWDDGGQDLIEYAFLALFIALVVIAGVQAVGTAINGRMDSIATQVGS